MYKRIKIEHEYLRNRVIKELISNNLKKQGHHIRRSFENN